MDAEVEQSIEITKGAGFVSGGSEKAGMGIEALQ